MRERTILNGKLATTVLEYCGSCIPTTVICCLKRNCTILYRKVSVVVYYEIVFICIICCCYLLAVKVKRDCLVCRNCERFFCYDISNERDCVAALCRCYCICKGCIFDFTNLCNGSCCLDLYKVAELTCFVVVGCVVAVNRYLFTKKQSVVCRLCTSEVVCTCINLYTACVFLENRSAGRGIDKCVLIYNNRCELITVCGECAIHIIKSNYLICSTVYYVFGDNKSHILNKLPVCKLEECALVICLVSADGKRSAADKSGKVGCVIRSAFIKNSGLIASYRSIEYVICNFGIALK